jgi:putative selenate reductase molybdopterin-binding subunit
LAATAGPASSEANRVEIRVTLNREPIALEAEPGERLLPLLRRAGCFGVKHGCETGECGACLVLVDGRPRNACILLAAHVAGRRVETIEGLGEHPEQGWRRGEGLHPLQAAFVANGAIQCGYCTPGMILAAKALLAREPDPSEAEVRDALSGVLCRCTGYVKPVEAVLSAAAVLRGERPSAAGGDGDAAIPAPPGLFEPDGPAGLPEAPTGGGDARTTTLPHVVVAPSLPVTRVVGRAEPKVDAIKLVQGKPAFTDDVEPRGLLIAKVLWSPVAHARIRRIDAGRARALPGVHAVLTHADLPRVVYSTAGQSDPIPGPLDTFSLDGKVRFVGDRVAFVAAETEAIAEEALALIEVEYEELPAVLDAREALAPGAPVLHDEPEYVAFGGSDPARNLAAEIRIDIGDVEAGFARADRIFEDEYIVPKVQQASIEPHVAVTYWDEDDRLVIRTSTQVPFHVRRILAPVLNLPPRRIRVVKPRIGGGFGGKQEVLIEDVAAHLTIATGRPVRF